MDNKQSNNSIKTHGLAHGRLDGESADILPILLQQRDKEVDTKRDVGGKFFWGHIGVSDSNRQAENLLHLELDGGLEFFNLGGQGIGVGQDGRELAGLVEARTEDTGNLLDERFGGEEGIISLGELLDQLLVFVELLEVISGHARDIFSLGFITVLLVTEDADLHLGTGDVAESENTPIRTQFNGMSP